MRIKQISEKYGYGMSTIAAWIRKGLLPAAKIRNKGRGRGNGYSVREDDFIAFLQARPRRRIPGKTMPPRENFKKVNTTEDRHIEPLKPVIDEPIPTPIVEDNSDKCGEEPSWSNRDYLIFYMDEYLKEVYNTNELTPHNYMRLRKVLEELKNESK